MKLTNIKHCQQGFEKIGIISNYKYSNPVFHFQEFIPQNNIGTRLLTIAVFVIEKNNNEDCISQPPFLSDLAMTLNYS